MSYSRSTIVKQAKTWLGRKEVDGSHREIIDVYNGHAPLARGYKVKYTDAWCATFVSACAIKCGYTDIIPTECSCPKMIELFKKKGRWVERDSYIPSPGDVLFYDWQDSGIGDNTGRSDHVGIVEKVNGNTIVIIEGNYSNSVKRRTLKANGKYIRGYGIPKYDKVHTTTSKKVVAENPARSKQDSLAGSYRTTSNLNMRHGAGTSKKIMVVIPKNTTVKNYGFYTEVNNIKWLYIQVTIKGIVYEGFCSSNYLDKI